VLAFTLFTIVAFSGTAQSANEVATPASSSNLLATLLMITTIILVFVIWGMGQALIVISKQVMEKSSKKSKILSVVLLLIGSFFSKLCMAQDATAITAVESIAASPNYGGLSPNNFYAFVGVILIEMAAIFFLTFSIKRVYQELLPEKVPNKLRSFKLVSWWNAFDKKFFTKAVAVEKEADILLDHDYDGIKELDNSLPPWWKYGFIITIIVAFIYIGYYHVLGSGKNPTEEYAAEIEQANIEMENYEANNKDKVDENNIPMADEVGLQSAKLLYEANCVACHLADGGGNVGPNLTDDYWLHKGSLNDIYKTLKIGYADKGMQSWSSKFSPKEMGQIASYIKTFKGTKPAQAKAPQGDLYIEETAAGIGDSTSTAKQ